MAAVPRRAWKSRHRVDWRYRLRSPGVHERIAIDRAALRFAPQQHPVTLSRCAEIPEKRLGIMLALVERFPSAPPSPPPSRGAGAESSIRPRPRRSEAHTSELQSLMRISYAVF